MTLSTLAQDFTANYMATQLRPSTFRGYSVNINRHILPHIGSVSVDALTVDDLDRLTASLQHTGLSNKTVVYALATLRKMLNYAVKRAFIAKSPFEQFDMPRVQKYRYRVLNRVQIGKLLAAVKGSSLELPVVLALCYGLRRGECLGIIPSLDLDAGENTLHIQRTRSYEKGGEVVTPCKTDNGNRLILLSPEHTAMLARCGDGYAVPFLPRYLNKHFQKLLSELNLPAIRFHDLRHSYATFMLSRGVNAKIVCAVLGHSSVSVTLDIYSHPDVTMQSVCLQAFAGI